MSPSNTANAESAWPVGPCEVHNLALSAPIDRWEEAIPLGNGLLGVLLWGQGNNLKLTVDRGDLWDHRTKSVPPWSTLRKLVEQGDTEKIFETYEKHYWDRAYPTKIPGGRIELTLGDEVAADCFHLDMQKAVASVDLGAASVETFCSATEPVIMFRVRGSSADARLVPPAYNIAKNPDNPRTLANLDYPPPATGEEGSLRWLHQTGAQGFEYAIVIAWRKVGDATEFACAVTTNADGRDPVADGKQLVDCALDTGFDGLLCSHVQWWEQFWSRSAIEISDDAIARNYYMAMYLYGSGSRRGAPPIGLHGVWTPDWDLIPPWRGDYHHDLNTQFTYYPYLTSNHMDAGLSFIDMMWNLLPAHREYAKTFYETPGACAPGVMTLDGQAIPGYAQYNYSPTNSVWVSHLFYLHWRYTMDAEFLATRAFPYCQAIGQCIEALLEEGDEGKLKLLASTSPEIHENALAAWVTPNSNYDLSLLRWLFDALAEMAGALGDAPEADHWSGLLDRLDTFAISTLDADGENPTDAGPLMISPDERLAESHRHHAHLMPVHPMAQITVEGSDRDRRVIDSTLQQLDALGTKAWCHFSFSWASAIFARTGRPERAREMLEIFVETFLSRSGISYNGDFQQLGYCDSTSDWVTFEGPFTGADALNEMLLQSWGGVVRVFPAISEQWKDAAFRTLRAQGAFLVSARRKGGKTVGIRVQAQRDGVLRLRDPFAGQQASWTRQDFERSGGDLVFQMAAGQFVEGHL